MNVLVRMGANDAGIGVSASPVLEVKDLNIEFLDHSMPETVVYDFDLSLGEGDIVGIVWGVRFR